MIPDPTFSRIDPMRRSFESLAGFLLGPALLAAPLAAQLPTVPANLDSAVHRIFASATYAPREGFGPAEWIEGGSAYTTVEPAADGRGVGHRPLRNRHGVRRVFVPAERAGPAGGRRAARI